MECFYGALFDPDFFRSLKLQRFKVQVLQKSTFKAQGYPRLSAKIIDDKHCNKNQALQSLSIAQNKNLKKWQKRPA
ncbi:hypothetical protein HBZS_104190 [Helicobacter bizzozeronii CCUG 35545]|nr:hypothetical protein HBZS_104190 [Helicobacter bizzozeronii CCUG 35545]